MSKPYFSWVVSFSGLLLLLGACATSVGDTALADEDYILNADEAEIFAGTTDASTLAAQGLPGLIMDPDALFNIAFKFLDNDDELAWTHKLPSGTYSVRVTARAELYQGAPKLAMIVGGQSVQKTFEQTRYQTLDYGIIRIRKGEKISLRFVNDKWDGSRDKDRNVILSHLELQPSEGEVGPAPSEPTEPAPRPSTGKVISTAYSPYTGELLNPERGFHATEWVTNQPGYTAFTDFAGVRGRGYSLIRTHVGLDEFKDGPISEARLSEIRSALSGVREAGLKALLIISYTFPVDGGYGNGDAPLSVVSTHLEQLRPIFEAYKDVIALVQGGFIGPWGEWHSSSHNLHNEPGLSQVYNKILEVLPKERMLTVRYVQQLRDLPEQRLNDATAHGGGKAARTGLTNMCFLVDSTDGGTYGDVDADKGYLADISKHVPVGGETCSSSNTYTLDPGEVSRYDCATAQEELERFHWTFISPYFGSDSVFDRWREEGCLGAIINRLGYRLELKTSSIQKEARAGEPLAVSFVVKNTGYAAPFNPRGLAIVLRNQNTGSNYTMSILQNRSNTLDPRKWYHEAGDITVTASPTVPRNVPAGTYDVFLSLHDPEPLLSNRPEYSIRLANQNVWDEATGLNLLAKGVEVR